MTSRAENEIRLTLASLQTRRTEIAALITSLSSPPLDTVTSSDMLDSEGFPLPSADMQLLKEARVRKRRLAEAQNDYTQVMGEIEKLLPMAFSPNEVCTGALKRKGATDFGIESRPFATVTNVLEGSAAWAAGIRTNDQLLAFGRLSNIAFSSDSELIRALKFESLNQASITVRLLRQDTSLDTRIFIRSGLGLGMHLTAAPPPLQK